MKQLLLNDNVLRSAFASKLAYNKNIPFISHYLHGTNSNHLTVTYVKPSQNPIISKDLLTTNRNKENLEYVHIEDTTNIIKSAKKTVEVYTWESGDRSILFAFKGCTSLRDFYTYSQWNLHTFSFREYTLHVHKGMYEMFCDIEENLSELIMKKVTPNKKLFVTFCGHSLGGALAIFASCYYYYLTNGNIDIQCHTFGSPKIGDASMMEWIRNTKQNHVYFQIQGDIIPFLPLHKGYLHNDEYIHRLTSTIKHRPFKQYVNPFIAHDMDTYINELNSAIFSNKSIY